MNAEAIMLEATMGAAMLRLARAEGHRKGFPCAVSGRDDEKWQAHRSAILADLRRHGPRTRTEVRRSIGLDDDRSKRMTEEMLDEGLIRDAGPSHGGGRLLVAVEGGE